MFFKIRIFFSISLSTEIRCICTAKCQEHKDMLNDKKDTGSSYQAEGISITYVTLLKPNNL